MGADRQLCAPLSAALLAGCLYGQGVAPYPRDDVATTREDEPIEIEVLANDHGADEVTRIATRPLHGTAEVQSDGTVLYTPAPETSGEDAFSYVVKNEHGTAAAPVTVQVAIDSERFGEPSVPMTHEHALEPFPAVFDDDGQADLVLRVGDRTLALFGDGDGFREAAAWGKSGCCARRTPYVADLDRDGDSDIVRFDDQGNLTVHLLEATRGGDSLLSEDHVIDHSGPDGLEIEGFSPRFGAVPTSVVSGDFDDDGAIDLAVSLDVFAAVLHSDVSTGVPVRSRLITEQRIWAMASGDVTGDGRSDLVLLGDVSLSLVSFEGDEPSLARIVTLGQPVGTQVLITQLDDDDREELVLINGESITVLDVRIVDGKVEVDSLSIESGLRNATLADVVGDTRLDLVGTRNMPYVVEVWEPARIDGASTLKRHSDFTLPCSPIGAPAVLPSDDRGRLLIGCYTAEDFELVAFSGQPESASARRPAHP